MEHSDMYNQTNNEQYDVNSSVVHRFFRLLSWKENETIVDIGMGDGRFTIEGLLPKLPKDCVLVGSDLSASNVRYASNKYHGPNVQFVELDIATKELRTDFNGKFDHIFSFFALNWVRDLRQAFDNMFAMSKPGAEFLISTVEKGVEKAFYNLSRNPKWACYGHEQYIPEFFHVEDRLPIWINLLKEAGFVNLNCFREYVVYKQKDRQVCEDMFKSINPIARRIPKDVLDDYYKDYIDELFRTNLNTATISPETNEEIITTNFETLIIYGRKPEAPNNIK